MAISSSGGADPVDTGGVLRATSGSVESPQGGTFTSDALDTTAGADSLAGSTIDGGAGNDTIVGGAGNDTLESPAGNDTLATPEGGNDTLSGGRSDDEIKASLKEAGGIYADPRYEAGALEFEKTGDVSTETRDKLATEFNVPRNAIDQFIDGQKAARQLAASSATADQAKVIGEIHAVVGSAEAYGKFMEWSKENLSADEKTAYNDALDKAPSAAKVMLASFNDRYKAAGNGAPRDLTEEGRSAITAGVQGYASSAEMQKDMGSPEYASNPAFRAQVAAKVAVSKF